MTANYMVKLPIDWQISLTKNQPHPLRVGGGQ
jgi:hypothetical protein